MSLKTASARLLPLVSASSRAALTSRTFLPAFQPAYTRSLHSTARMASIDKPVATVDSAHLSALPESSAHLFAAKKQKQLSFEAIGKELGRNEVAVAAIFYGQAKASGEDAEKLAKLLDLDSSVVSDLLYGLPDRGRSVPMPPKEPLIYRLYEVVQNYGYAYKAVLNEKFGDGIMSAISFSTKVEKETDEKGDWVVITLRGKWLPFTRF